jgi:uncharacterized phage-like protein YoqJ
MIIAATGHRPDKLGGYSEGVRERLIDGAMRYLEQENPDEVISGMALGWDQAWAIAAIRLGIPLTCALPFQGQFSKWPPESQYWWREIVARANRVHFVFKGDYAPWKLLGRNKWMVDNSDKLCALWNGSDGGTAHCVAYARKKEKPVDNIWDDFAAVRA